MAYRNGTYVAFHADGNNIPGKTDIDYYQLMRAWSAHPDDEFTMVNSHEKAWAVKDSSSRSTLRDSLLKRLRNSKNMVLIIGETTRFDTDWVPFEIESAVNTYKIPIIITYTSKICSTPIRVPSALSGYWPTALATRIKEGSAHTIHMPFKKEALLDAISQFSHDNYPPYDFYSDAAYRAFGITG